MDGVIATNIDDFTRQRHWFEKCGTTRRFKWKTVTAEKYRNYSKIASRAERANSDYGSGGIDGVQNAQEKIKAGAELLQVYSGLIYHGPSLVKELVKAIK